MSINTTLVMYVALGVVAGLVLETYLGIGKRYLPGGH